ncbi:MAG: ATP synthase F1 subunit delta [Candidatus Paceibacterota bacterium]|jgi:F-type H+-transporting ATPase subunit delta
MKITPKQYALSLYESTQNCDKDEISKRILSFIDVLRKNNDLSQTNKIIQYYYQHYRQVKNITKIEIKSSEKLGPNIISKILEKFNKQVEIEEKIDPALIGGVVIRINDNILIDGSIKRKLEDIKEKLA